MDLGIGVWYPLQILQGQMTSSPTWQKREPGIEVFECTPQSLIITKFIFIKIQSVGDHGLAHINSFFYPNPFNF